MDQKKNIIRVFDIHAPRYEEKYMDLSLYKNALDRFCTSLPETGVKLLDMACGPGNITRYLLSKHPGYNITGTDIAPKMLELASKNNPSARFEIMDCRDLGKTNELYHGIICGFGLPYLSKPEVLHFIQDTYNKLMPGGILYISAMEDDYEKSEWLKSSTGEGPALFIHYHQADYLHSKCLQVGFSIIYLERPNQESMAETKTELIIIAKKAENLAGI